MNIRCVMETKAELLILQILKHVPDNLPETGEACGIQTEMLDARGTRLRILLRGSRVLILVRLFNTSLMTAQFVNLTFRFLSN